MTQEKKQKTWLTTYLVTFILLHNIALITKHDAEYAKKHGMRVSSPRLGASQARRGRSRLTTSTTDTICKGGQCQGVQLG